MCGCELRLHTFLKKGVYCNYAEHRNLYYIQIKKIHLSIQMCTFCYAHTRLICHIKFFWAESGQIGR